MTNHAHLRACGLVYRGRNAAGAEVWEGAAADGATPCAPPEWRGDEACDNCERPEYCPHACARAKCAQRREAVQTTSQGNRKVMNEVKADEAPRANARELQLARIFASRCADLGFWFSDGEEAYLARLFAGHRLAIRENERCRAADAGPPLRRGEAILLADHVHDFGGKVVIIDRVTVECIGGDGTRFTVDGESVLRTVDRPSVPRSADTTPIGCTCNRCGATFVTGTAFDMHADACELRRERAETTSQTILNTLKGGGG